MSREKLAELPSEWQQILDKSTAALKKKRRARILGVTNRDIESAGRKTARLLARLVDEPGGGDASDLSANPGPSDIAT